MAVKISIAGIDFTDRAVSSQGDYSALIGDLTHIAQSRKYVFKNQDRYLSPFFQTGFLAVNHWRGRQVLETEDNGKVLFDGTIQNISQAESDAIVIIDAQESLVEFLEWPVNVNDKTVHVNFKVKSDVPKGNTIIPVKDGLTTIPAFSVVTFKDQIAPEYMIYSATGTPTTSISIDRPLDFDLKNNDTITVSVPVKQTGADAIRRALLTAGIDAEKLDLTFDILHQEDADNNRLIYMNIKESDKITLRQHLQTLQELCNLVVLGKIDGKISLRRGFAYQGETTILTLTGAELLPKVNIENDKSKLYIGYDCVYRHTDDAIKTASGDVDDSLVDAYAGQQFFQPVKVQQGLLNYRYLYNSAQTADYFGQSVISYHGHIRHNLLTGVKKSIHARADKLIKLDVGDVIKINYRGYENEPAIVLGFTYSKRSQQYTNVKMQLNNYPSPVVAVN